VSGVSGIHHGDTMTGYSSSGLLSTAVHQYVIDSLTTTSYMSRMGAACVKIGPYLRFFLYGRVYMVDGGGKGKHLCFCCHSSFADLSLRLIRVLEGSPSQQGRQPEKKNTPRTMTWLVKKTVEKTLWRDDQCKDCTDVLRGTICTVHADVERPYRPTAI
jgi:hypothetical protein